MKAFIDVAGSPEDDRIGAIGRLAMNGLKVAFCTDDEPGKADRYVKKLLERFPSLQEDSRSKGPGVVTVNVSLKPQQDKKNG